MAGNLAVPLVTQRISDTATAVSVAPGHIVDAMATLVDNQNTLYGAAALWYKSAHSPGNYVEFAPKTAANIDDRILIISGAIIAAGARANSTADTGNIYGCYAMNAGTTGPEQNPAVGNPYPSSPNTLGLSADTGISKTTVGYIENEAGMYWGAWDPTASDGPVVVGGGRWLVTLQGQLGCVAFGSGVSSVTATNVWQNDSGAQQPVFVSWGPVAASNLSSMVAISPTGTVQSAARSFSMNTTVSNSLRTLDTTEAVTFPIPIYSTVSNEALGILRQMRVGPDTSHRAALVATSGQVQGFAFATPANGNTGPAIYLTNFL